MSGRAGVRAFCAKPTGENDMQAYQSDIGNILTGNKRFFVPPYQRPYKWVATAASQLVRDIDESRQKGYDEYFIGSIICIRNRDANGVRYEVVDGQQRLITLTLIMQQIAAFVQDEDIRGSMRSRMINPHKKGGAAALVEVRQDERDFYLQCILKGGDVPANITKHQSVFLKNRDAIKGFLSTMKQGDIDELAGYLIENVYVVFVEVDNLVSSFRLFNVLNSRGMPLNDADLLKSVLLEKVAGSDDASRLVERRWREVENIAEDNEEELDKFLALHQISEKPDRDRVKKKNFDYYEPRLTNDFGGDSVKMSDMLLSSAQRYGDILGGKTNAASTTAFLAGFAKPEEWIPAFMAFLNKHGSENFPEFATLFEKVYMQAWLMRIPKSKREGACYHAIQAINGDKSLSGVMSSLHALENNQQFEEQLDVTDFYDPSRPQIIKLVKFVLQRVDQARHDDSAPKEYTHKITVEHILPQKMTHPYWKKRFDNDQYKEWLHKLGNLTLISRGKNSAARNLGFDEKKQAYERLNQKSPFDITKELCDLPEWNMDALQKRHEKLKREIIKLWRVDELV